MDILERLQQYNPPDRTVDSQRQISVDIWEAVDRIKALEAEVEDTTQDAEYYKDKCKHLEAEVEEHKRRAFFLQAFAQHKGNCAKYYKSDCDCGLDELLAEKGE